MTRTELHAVRRPYFDCTSLRVAPASAAKSDEMLHLYTAVTRTLPKPTVRYTDIKVALRLAA